MQTEPSDCSVPRDACVNLSLPYRGTTDRPSAEASRLPGGNTRCVRRETETMGELHTSQRS